MRYTVIYIDSSGDWGTMTCVSSHDKNVAWIDVQQYLPAGAKIKLLSPGDQVVYSEKNIKPV